MCLISLAYHADNEYPLIVIANRDEFLARPSTPAQFWPDNRVLAGKDLQAGGTWMGITRDGRFAGITNYRDPADSPGPVSRGKLVSDFLQGYDSTAIYADHLAATANNFSGYNVLFGHINDLRYFSNRGGRAQRLTPGIYGLSNHLLCTPWPKIEATKRALTLWTRTTKGARKAEQLFSILANQTLAKHDELPNTGIDINLEKALSANFIRLPHYATRTSTILLINTSNEVTFIERTFIYSDVAQDSPEPEKFANLSAEPPPPRETRTFHFELA